MNIKVAYGSKNIKLNISNKNKLEIIQPHHVKVSKDGEDKGEAIIKKAIAEPTASRTLKDIIKKKNANNAVVVVNDITRPTPYQYILPPLLREIEEAGILPENVTLLVALGIHRPHTKEENRAIFGDDICSKYRVKNHNCDEKLAVAGVLNNGWELKINKEAVQADLLITTGLVNLHYFAGYSGGRKSILPGIAARELITNNHKMMNDERACLGNYKNNPVSDIMLEAARKVGVDFIVNVVAAGKNEILYAAAGDLYEAWLSCIEYCEKINVVSIEQKADIVVAGCGGYPKDINMYQSQKALDAASLAVKKGGTIILLAECREGLGEATFEEWIKTAQSPHDIFERFNNDFELGGHKAFAICRTLEKANIILVSELDRSSVEDMFLQYASSAEEALKMALTRHGEEASIIVMPEASKTGIKVKSGE